MRRLWIIVGISLFLGIGLVVINQEVGKRQETRSKAASLVDKWVYPKAVIRYQGRELKKDEIVRVNKEQLVTLDGLTAKGQLINQGYVWTWDEKQSLLIYGPSASHSYAAEGKYRAELMVINQDNKNVDTVGVWIQVGSSAESEIVKYAKTNNLANDKIIKTSLAAGIKPNSLGWQYYVDKVMNRKEKVAILVYRETYNQIRAELDEYARWVNEKFGSYLDSPIRIYDDSSWNNTWANYCPGNTDKQEAFRIRRLLKDLNEREGVTGVLLVGKIPYFKWFEKSNSISRTSGPRRYNITPCSLCYEDLNTKFTDEFKGNAADGSSFCGNSICDHRVPTPAPVSSDNCLNDGYNPNGDGIMDTYYFEEPSRGTEVWTAWIRPLITGGAANSRLDETGGGSELQQMKNMLGKFVNYLRNDGQVGQRSGEVLISKSCFSASCRDDQEKDELAGLSVPGLMRNIYVMAGSGINLSQQPNFQTVLSEDATRYFLFHNRSYGLPDRVFHPGGIGIANGEISSQRMWNQSSRSLVTELATCANANFDRNPRDNFAISSLTVSPQSQIVEAISTETCATPHQTCFSVDFDNDVYGESNVTNGMINMGSGWGFYKNWEDTFYGKAWAIQQNRVVGEGLMTTSIYTTGRNYIGHLDNRFMFGNPFVWWWKRASPTVTPSATPTPVNCQQCSTQYKFCEENWRSGSANCQTRIPGSTAFGLNCNCRGGSFERPGDDCRWQDCIPTVCDVNCDGRVDFYLGTETSLDYQKLRDCIGSSSNRRTANCQNDCNFNRADYTQDGLVDIEDFSALRNLCMGQGYVTPIPYPTATPTPICVAPGGAVRLSGPEMGQKLNYGWPSLKIRDDSDMGSCFPHDVVLSIWQNNVKYFSPGFSEDVIQNVGQEFSWQVNPALPPGNYQWRANLRNTANQTTALDLIPKTNFTVCGQPAKPLLINVKSGEQSYDQIPTDFRIFTGETIQIRIKDMSQENSCYPHNVIFNIWPDGGNMYIKSSGWQLNKINLAGGTFEGTLDTNGLVAGNYQLRANLSNFSLDEKGQMHQYGSRPPEPLIIPFQLINETCDPVTCVGSCGGGRSCRPDPSLGGECQCW